MTPALAHFVCDHLFDFAAIEFVPDDLVPELNAATWKPPLISKSPTRSRILTLYGGTDRTKIRTPGRGILRPCARPSQQVPAR